MSLTSTALTAGATTASTLESAGSMAAMLGNAQALATEQATFQLGMSEIQQRENMMNTYVSFLNDTHKSEQKAGQEAADNGSYR